VNQTLSPFSSSEPGLSSTRGHLSNDRIWLSEFTNDFNEVRLKLVQGKLDLNDLSDRQKCIRLYQEWVSDDNYLLLKKTAPNGAIEYQAHKARKRGNDVDAYRIGRQLREIGAAVVKYTKKGERLRSTSAAYVTGTVDPRVVDYDVESAWQYLAYWFNIFVTSLRKHCQGAKIRVFRSWESHESSWPHFHAILCFEGFSWSIFQDASSRWRLEEKRVFEDAWSYGWIDVLALTPGTAERNIEKVVWYVSKYVAKGASDADYRHVDSWPLKKRLTESLLWYFGKRSYSISRDLIGPGDSAVDLKKRISTTQTNLEGSIVPEPQIEWEFVGLVRRKDTELGRDDWVKSYANPPDWLDLCWKPSSCSGSLGWTSSWGD
jgi:hypothetical protein